MEYLTKLLLLFVNFFYIGAFSFGGGNAMIPLIEEVVIRYNWMNYEQFADMIAISQITPGPIAINMATYVGYTSGGPLGSLLATIAVCLPAFILISLLMRFIMVKFKDNFYVKGVLVGLRPAVIGLIAVAVLRVAKIALINKQIYEITNQFITSIQYSALIITIVSFIVIYKLKVHPILCIAGAGLIGIGSYLCSIL